MNKIKKILIEFVAMILFWTPLSKAQNSGFYKTLNAPAAFHEAYVYLDTISSTEFVAGGPATWFATTIQDTLTYDSYLLQHDDTGLLTWHKRYHYSKRLLRFFSFDVLKNKNILVGGVSNTSFYSFTAPNHGVLMLTNQNGNIIWTRSIPFYEVMKVKELSNENKIIVLSDTLGSPYILMLDKYFNFKWGKRLSTIGSGYLNHIVEGKNGSFLLLGGYNGMASYIALLDSMGNLTNDLDSPNVPQWVLSGFKNNDNGFYVCGARVRSGTELNGTLMKLDNQLNIVWFKEYNLPSNIGEFQDIIRVSANNILVMGEPENQFSTEKYSNLIFMDTNGVIRRSYYFMSDSFPSLPTRAFLLSSGKVLFNSFWTMKGFGVTDTISNSFCGSQNVNWTLKDTVSNFSPGNFQSSVCGYSYQNINLISYPAANVTCNYQCSTGPNVGLEKEEPLNESVVIYPIPTRDVLKLKYQRAAKKRSSELEFVYLLNAQGEKVYSTKWHYREPSLIIDVFNFSSGIYTLILTDKSGQTFFKKVVVTHD